jgi:hypothetical protein
MGDLNDVIALLLSEHPQRAATSDALAAQIATRDLWRCPLGRRHPEAWHLEVWVRSEYGRGRFELRQGTIELRRAAGDAVPIERWRQTA